VAGHDQTYRQPDVSPCTECLLDAQEAAARCRLSVQTIRRMTKSGELAVVKIRRSVRIPESEIIRIMTPNEAWSKRTIPSP
jgi:excisionase family DNA binding protein